MRFVVDTRVIYELLKEVREEQKAVREEQQEHREEALKWQSEASGRLDRIEVDLRDHKEGVVQNRTSIKIFDRRLQQLEEPRKAREYLFKKTMKWLALFGGIVTIASGVTKVLGLW